ncbi:MAG TPA: hypothetical protein VE307_04580 [Nitrososphaeraceae archaeon]|nr:hypothetical protein [Nitrososphaeraceae archaeon]
MATKESIFIAIVLAVSTSMISFSILNANAQTENTDSEYSIDISKDATSGLIVTDGASYVNGFDTTYTIKGKQFDYDKARDLVVSAIADDFTNSSTSGYVKVEDTSSSSSNATGLANPFASKEQINEKIKSVLNGAIDGIFSGAGLTFTIGPATYVIKCTFGDSLDDFECSQQGGFKF